jgi:hypothetical protein
MGTSIQSLMSTLENTTFDEDKIDQLESLADIFSELGDGADRFSAFTDAFTRFQSPFAQFTNTMGVLATNFGRFEKYISGYERFTKSTNSFADRAIGYQKFAPAFSQITKDMGIFSVNFKIMDEAAIAAFDKWTQSLIEVSKINETSFGKVVGKIGELFTKPFEQGAADQGKDPAKAKTPAGQKEIVADANKPKPGQPEKPQAPKIDMTQMILAINSLGTKIDTLNTNLTQTGIKIKN